ncbi:hypothetical protein SCUP234_04117 [Seiridium cupressi]
MEDHAITTAIGILVAILAIAAVALRFYTRRYTETGHDWDDWLILVALLATILTDILVLWANIINPDGAEDVSATNSNHSEHSAADVEYVILTFTASVLYFTITSATKLSILLMYNRLFSVDPMFRRQIIAACIVVICFWIGCTVADLLNCIPLKWTWNNNLLDPRYCFNYNVFWLASGIVEACIDLLIIIMPVKLVLSLQLNGSRKVAIAAVFLLGIFVILSGLVKVIMSYAPGVRGPAFGKAEVWTTVHCGIGIVCACLPVCWSLFTRLTKLVLRTWPSLCPARRYWYSRSGWSSVDRRSGPRNSTPNTEGAAPVGAGGYELAPYKAREATVVLSFGASRSAKEKAEELPMQHGYPQSPPYVVYR